MRSIAPSFANRLQCPADEPSTAVWEQYAKEVAEAGTLAILGKYIVQLRFEIEKGISAGSDYLAATRKGLVDLPASPFCPSLKTPELHKIVILDSLGGRLPAIIVANRPDFESLVRVFTARNEPASVPLSMGACLVTGFNNWHRISMARKKAIFHDGLNWPNEFQRLKQTPELYQDTFVILSSGPYSGVPASIAGMDSAAWLAASLAIRAEHECVHYLSRRLLGRSSYTLADEVIADFYAILKTLGEFRAEILLHFFGLERFPDYRQSGRLANYLALERLGDGEFDSIQTQVFLAAQNLEQLSANIDVDAKAVCALLSISLEELADHSTMKSVTTRLFHSQQNTSGGMRPPPPARAQIESFEKEFQL